MARPASQGRRRYVLALDFGTSALHCLLTDSLGKPIDSADAPISFSRPESGASLAREFDPESVLAQFREIMATLLSRQDARPEDIAAIGLTGQRGGVVFADAEGKELYCGPNVDLRAVFEGAALDEEMGREVYNATGHLSASMLAAARLRWSREHAPVVYERTKTILTLAGWLAYRLTGELASEPSLDCETGLLDVNTRQRSSTLMSQMGIPESLLPPLSHATEPVGRLIKPVAEAWGLKQGTPVVISGPDTQCGLLGMGLLQVGQAGAVIGWSGSVQILTPQPCHDVAETRTSVGCFPVEGLWVAESNMGDAGNAYRWLKETLFNGHTSYEEIDALALSSAGSSEGVVALLGPSPITAMKAGLRLGGLIFPTPLTFQDTSRGDLFHAALENIAFSVRSNLATLLDVTGLDPPTIHLGGGMARGRGLATVLATVLGQSVRRSLTYQASGRGAAMTAAVAAEPTLTIRQVAQEAAGDFEEMEPGFAGDIARYQESYGQWLDLYERLRWK